MPDISMRDRILDAAERRARSGGYHSVSFRDIAEVVGIKSASVHYHFPTKSDLMTALAARYTRAASDMLPPPRDYRDAVGNVAALFEASLRDNQQMCLCGMFGAEHDALPSDVQTATRAYFTLLLDYLENARSDQKTPSPAVVIATLEGGLILARSLGDEAIFRNAFLEIATQD